MTLTRTHRRASVALAATVTLASLLSACGSTSTDSGNAPSASKNDIAATPRDQVADGGTLRWPIDDLPPNFNYNEIDGTYSSNFDIISAMLPATFDADAAANLTVNKNYFTSIELTSTSPQTVTYTINPKATWSDGKPLSVADFQAQWKALNGTDAKFQVSSSTGYEDIGSVSQGTDSRQAVVVFKKTFADWKSLFNPIYPASVNATPDSFNKSQTNGLTISGGPFKFAGIDKTTQSITAARDDSWWGDKAKLDKIVYRVLQPDAQIDALANKEIDFIDIGPDVNKLQRATNTAGVVVRRAAGPNFRHITINGTGPILKELAVRRAVAQGIDRQQIANAMLTPLGVTPTTLDNHIFMTNQTGYQSNNAEITYNPEVAKAALDKAGWTQSGQFRAKGGQELTVNLLIPTGVATATQESSLIQQQLKAIGVNVKITSRDQDFFDYITAGTFDMTMFTWLGTPFPISSSKSIYANPQGDNIQQNYARIGSPLIDKGFNDANSTLDPVKAIQIANDTDKLIWQEVHSLTTYQRPDLKGCVVTLVNYGALGFASVKYQDVGFAKSASPSSS